MSPVSNGQVSSANSEGSARMIALPTFSRWPRIQPPAGRGVWAPAALRFASLTHVDFPIGTRRPPHGPTRRTRRNNRDQE